MARGLSFSHVRLELTFEVRSTQGTERSIREPATDSKTIQRPQGGDHGLRKSCRSKNDVTVRGEGH